MKALLPNLISNASLFLSYELFEHEDLDAARDWFMNKIEFLFPTYEFHDIAYIFTLRPEYLDLANGIIKISNVGIEKLELYKVPIELYLGLDQKDLVKQIIAILQENSFHSFKDYMGNYCTAIKDNDGKISIVKLICYHENEYKSLIPFDVDQESRGTIVLLHLIPALIRSYGEGINYFLDDINTSLHPVLLKEILGQYLSLNLGQAKGQLIFNSHEDFLMDEKIIRQDELWLMEKNNGASIIFPLTDFPNVRFDLNLRKNYLNGKFGAVPFESEPQKIVFGE
ncbi:MAG: ATP-binding protein [Saprospiraceae bacterium]|nr:ATP-binding protein [Saprospiraceae bacterium]